MNNYYPFGMIKEGMFAKTGEGYRYGFNGMERDNETKGFGNDLSTFFRGYDPRLGRWKSVDPVTKAMESAYVGFGNNPVYFVDKTGDTPNGFILLLDFLFRDFQHLTTNSAIDMLKVKRFFSSGYTIMDFGRIFEKAVIASIGEKKNTKKFTHKSSRRRRIPDLVVDKWTSVVQDVESRSVVFKNAVFGEIKFRPEILKYDMYYKEQLTDMIDILSEQKGAYINGEYFPNMKASEYNAAELVFFVPANTLIDPELIEYATSKNVRITSRIIEEDVDEPDVIRVAPLSIPWNYFPINDKINTEEGGAWEVPMLPGHSERLELPNTEQD